MTKSLFTIGLASEAALHGADRIGLASEAALHGADRIGLASEATLHGRIEDEDSLPRRRLGGGGRTITESSHRR